MEKLCPKCNFIKDERDYTPSQFRLKAGKCKSCIKLRNTKHYENNKEVLLPKIKARAKNQADEIAVYQKEYREDNKEKIASLKREWYSLNKEEINRLGNEYQKDRRHNDPTYKLRKYMSSYIGLALKRTGSSKSGDSILNFLPYSIEELRRHLEQQFEPWMTWDNQGKYNSAIWNDSDSTTWTWHIDHIISQADLPYTSMDEENFQKCWALENLRPLSAKQNVIDGRRKL